MIVELFVVGRDDHYDAEEPYPRSRKAFIPPPWNALLL